MEISGSLSLSLLPPSPSTSEEYSPQATSRDGENLSCFYLVGSLSEILTSRLIFFPQKRSTFLLFFPFKKQTNQSPWERVDQSSASSRGHPPSVLGWL